MAFSTSLPTTRTAAITDTLRVRWLPLLAAQLQLFPNTLACVDTATGRFSQPTGAATVLLDGVVAQDFNLKYDAGPDKTQQVRIDRPAFLRIKITDNVTDADLLKKVYIVPNRDDAVTKTVPGAGNVTYIGVIDYVHGTNDVTIRMAYQSL